MEKQIEQIIQVVQQRYSNDFWKYHILPVLKNALALAKQIPETKEKIVEMAVYLHDIARFLTPGKLGLNEDHHIVGTQMAKKLLEEYGYDSEFIEQVGRCILSHRGKRGPAPETIEAKIVACADAMAHFDTFFYVFKLFLDTSDTTEEAIDGVEQKMLRDWKKLTLPEAQDISRKKYEAIMLLIQNIKSYK